MFLAGDEFGDQNDFFDENGNVTQRGGKQVNPVNFGRLTAGPPDPHEKHPRDNQPDQYFGPMRRRIHAYIKTLIALRTTARALAVNDTDFIWTDFGEGKRVIVWRRGGAMAAAPVIVLANFSDFASAPGTEYVVPTWPGPAPAGKKWVEVTQRRDVGRGPRVDLLLGGKDIYLRRCTAWRSASITCSPGYRLSKPPSLPRQFAVTNAVRSWWLCGLGKGRTH